MAPHRRLPGLVTPAHHTRLTTGAALIGTPEQITEQFAELSEAGLSGAIFGFHDYVRELKEFGQEVMPLMRRHGLRR